MTRKNAAGVRCCERRAILMSLIIYHCCYSSTTISALQVQTRRARPLSTIRSLFSSETTIMPRGSKRRRQKSASSLYSSSNSQENHFQDVRGIESSLGINRREVFSDSAKFLFAGLATPFLLNPADPANALLIKFPIDAPNTQPLKNRYHFMRAGESELEEEGIYSTNPLFLTNRDNAMSDKGYKSLREAVATLKKASYTPTVAYHSLAANGMDTGDLIARELKLGRDRLLPEFTYLDQRGVGLWDNNEEAVVRPAVWAMDKLEAGDEGFGGRPPANTDGTPNDTLHDQFTRLRQFLSLQETRTAGETILVIFPDGTGPALLSCMIAGIPYTEVHALEFKPGELRLDITPGSVQALYESRKDDPTYLATIEEGKEKLQELRQLTAKDFSVSFKDSQADQKEQAEIEASYARQQAAAAERRKVEEERREAMQEQIRLSKEKAQEKDERRRSEQLALKEKKEQEKAQQQAAYLEKKRKQAELQAAAKQKQAEAQAERKRKYEELAAAKVARKQETSSEPSDSSSSLGLPLPVLVTAALGVVGSAVLVGGGEDEDENNNYSAVTTTKDGSGGDDNAAKTISIAEAVPETTPQNHAATPIKSNKEERNKKEEPKLDRVPSIASTNSNATQTIPIASVAEVEIPEIETIPPGSNEKEERLKEMLRRANKDDSSGDKNAVETAETLPISSAVQEESPKIRTTLPASDEKEGRLKEMLRRANRRGSSDDANAAETKHVPIQPKNPEARIGWRKRISMRSRRDAGSTKEDPKNAPSITNEDEFTRKLQAAEQEMKNAFKEAANIKKKKQEQQPQNSPTKQQQQPPKKKSSLFDNDPPVILTTSKKTTNYVYDDDEDDSDWLRVLGEIRDEVEDDDDDDDDFGMVDYATFVGGTEL